MNFTKIPSNFCHFISKSRKKGLNINLIEKVIIDELLPVRD